jgi:hypothetical protein
MIFATIPVGVAVLGLLVFALSGGPGPPYSKVAEAGRIAFACGLLVALFALMHSGAVRILAP